ncbi:Gfo/Idh/MocA family oxidoreductase [Curtobacterium sp. BRD11]|uniref:Gfo/Idh/MocA family protein n=1 Tax=Curtobacterium sp. BRD11 TaxID=2962581 RepID=UPI002882A69C|nr:Gfo/Idh/MocA family oxidoreductase [Curtobacterium sp. BRD11]MDT0212073.1 Gfo/Idh/MocA family oxidoreductase [Curtobacterium sp. BRD11]
MRVAILGCGLIGQRRGHVARQLGDEVVAVYDTNGERRNTAGAFFDAQPAPSTTALLESAADSVVIATTHVDLASLTRLALLAGKHVFVEKPGALSAHDLSLNATMASQLNLALQVGYTHQHHGHVAAGLARVSSGEFGRILSIRGFMGNGGRPGLGGEWRANPALSGGGASTDLLVHLIELTSHLLPQPDTYYLSTATTYWNFNSKGESADDNASLVMVDKSGAVANLAASWTEWANSFTFVINCETHTLRINGLGGDKYGETSLTLVAQAWDGKRPPEQLLDSTEYANRDPWAAEWQSFKNLVNQPAGPDGGRLNRAITTLTLLKQ